MSGPFNKGSARMFESPLLEKLSHVHPATPVILFAPIITASLWAALGVDHTPGITLAWHLVAGYLGWTLTEYWLHRLFFHLPVRGRWSERVYFFVHGVHHDWPWDHSRLVMPPSVSLILGGLFYLLFRALFGPAIHALFAGFAIGYVVYDTVHWYTHAGSPTSRVFKFLRREHLVHHFRESGTRFGVSCPWWDVVFRTTGR
ncbi:MAG TPA: sterol desaturase family protein [Kofleriaceae bacterium]|nr:sterol desaturase family protein [Kofleriaceae bacterium]